MKTANTNMADFATSDQVKLETLKQYRSLCRVCQSDFEAVAQLEARYNAAVKQLDAADYKTIADGVMALADCGEYKNSAQMMKDGVNRLLNLTDDAHKMLKEKDAKLALSVKKIKEYQTKSSGQNSKIKEYQEKSKNHEAELMTYKEMAANLDKQNTENKNRADNLDQQIKGYKDRAERLEIKLKDAQSKIALDEKLLNEYREKDTKQKLELNEANKKISELEKKLAEKANLSGAGNSSQEHDSSSTQGRLSASEIQRRFADILKNDSSSTQEPAKDTPKRLSADEIQRQFADILKNDSSSTQEPAKDTPKRLSASEIQRHLADAIKNDSFSTQEPAKDTPKFDELFFTDPELSFDGFLKDIGGKELQIQKNLNRYKVSSIYQFGKYPQKKKAKLWGKEEYLEQPIEWNILANDGEKLLLISSYAIEHKKYNEEFKGTNWENCSLRKWLNSDFITKAFSPEERKKILEVTNENKKNIVYSTSESNKTMDKVFLLSIDEVDRYFTKRKLSSNVLLNDYTMQWKNGIRNKWWLRTAGAGNDMAAVDDGGHLSYSGLPVNSDNGFVRPAVWVKI